MKRIGSIGKFIFTALFAVALVSKADAQTQPPAGKWKNLGKLGSSIAAVDTEKCSFRIVFSATAPRIGTFTNRLYSSRVKTFTPVARNQPQTQILEFDLTTEDVYAISLAGGLSDRDFDTLQTLLSNSTNQHPYSLMLAAILSPGQKSRGELVFPGPPTNLLSETVMTGNAFQLEAACSQ